MAESKEQGTAFKNEGNGHFVKGEYEEAIKAYTAGIEVDPTNHLLFANRAASLYYMKQYDQALTDIEKAIELDKDYSKVGHHPLLLPQCFTQKTNERMAAHRVSLAKA